MKPYALVFFVTYLIGVLLVSDSLAQALAFECSDSCSEYQAQEYRPPQPIGSVNMVIIYAVFRTPPSPPYISYQDSLPYWYDDIQNKMQNFLQTASHGLHNISITILTNGTKPFRAADDFQPGGSVYSNISPLFMSSLMDSVDAYYDLGLFDNDGPDGNPNSGDDDGYVDFVSLHVLWPLGRGGIGLNFVGSEWISRDPSNKTGFGNIRVTGQGNGAIQQIVYDQAGNEGLPMHEYGHAMGGLPDMDHKGPSNDYNHYSLGGFDIMAGGGFKGVASIYNPWFRDELLHWITPTPVTGNLIAEPMTDLITTRKLLKYTPAVPSNALPGQKFYVSYHTGTDPWEQNWPVSKTSEPGGTGGVLVWHIIGGNDYSDRRRQPIDLEAAHGKTNWTEDDNGVYNTGVPNAATGFDSLETRKISGGREIQGPYFQKDKGSASVFFVPNAGKEYAFYTNPNSNYYHNSAAESYAHNVTSGLAIKNMVRTGGTTKIDLYTNNYTITSNATLTAGNWYINGNITVASGVTLTIYPDAVLKFASGTSLTINGALAVNGTQTQPVTFDRSGTSGTWGGIKFGTSGSGTISYATIDHATKGVKIDITGNVTLDHCAIKNFTEQGVYLNGSSATVQYCTINNPASASHGIYVTGNNADPTLSGNTISSPPIGIQLASSIGLGTAKNNFISNCSNAGIQTYNSEPEIYNNYIHDCTYGVRLQLEAFPNLHDNDFYLNEIGLFLEQSQPSNLKWNNFGYTGGSPSYNTGIGMVINYLGLGNNFMAQKWNNFYDGDNNGYSADISNQTSFTLVATGQYWRNRYTYGPIDASSPQPSHNPDAGPGGGIGKIALSDEKPTEAIPASFTLTQNFPNPFNPTTKIRFSLPERAVVSLVIYDLNGRMVRNLINHQIYESGWTELVWDGTNAAGLPVGSGFYLYRLHAQSPETSDSFT